MRKDLFKHYTPRYFHQLQKDDFVWMINHSCGKNATVIRYRITNIDELENCRHMYAVYDYTVCSCDGQDYYERMKPIHELYIFTDEEPTCTYKWIPGYQKMFSDETVMKHSLDSWLKKRMKKKCGQLLALTKEINYLDELSKITDTNRMKLEKTCRCTASCIFQNDIHNTASKDSLEFVAGHEYQVDIETTLAETHYKVYQNGGWDDACIISENEFKNYFKLIQ